MDMDNYSCKTAEQIKRSEKYYKKKMDDLLNRINKRCNKNKE